jgi:hypothetical protein
MAAQGTTSAATSAATSADTRLTFLCNNFWQSVAQHRVDLPHETKHLYTPEPFVPENVRDGQTVFVKTDLLDLFCAKLLPRIRARFVLITGHSDLSPSHDAMAVLHADSRVARWYAKNATWADHKTIPIPLGLSEPDRDIGNQEAMRRAVRQAAAQHATQQRAKQCSVFCPSVSPTHPLRAMLQDVHHPMLARSDARLSFEDYLHALAGYKFVLCPRGNGIDVHRVHEAILVRTVPIYVSDQVPLVFRDLPVIVVQSIPHLRQVLDGLANSMAWDSVDWDAAQKYMHVDALSDVYGVTAVQKAQRSQVDARWMQDRDDPNGEHFAAARPQHRMS